MIFYKAIKYKILDYCLDMFFKKINENILPPGRVRANDVLPGMVFSRMIYKGNPRTGTLKRVCPL